MVPGLTLAMIVRNDADRLRRCLESVSGVVYQIVVVDTGSTDSTPDIAAEFGARVVHRDWPDAFDEAVNWALSEVETEWTLRLDSDEWLVPESRAELAKAIKDESAFAYTVIRENLDKHGQSAEGRMLRLWRTHPLMRVQGVIHEQFPPEAIVQAAGGRQVLESEIRIRHDGFAGGNAPEKLARNRALLERELQIRPGQIYYEIELAGTLLELNDPAGPAAVNDLADRLVGMQDEDEPPTSVASALLVQALDLVPEAELRSSRTDTLIRLANGWFPDDPGATWAVAQIHLKRGDLASAFYALSELERMSQKGHRGLGNFNPTVLREGLWTNLGIVAHQLGRKDVARRNYERLLKLNPNHPVASQNIRKL